MPGMKKEHIIGSLNGGSGSGSGGGASISEVNLLIKNHDENLNAHTKKIHEEEITSLSNVWSIQHNLNAEWYELNITCIDDSSNVLIGEIDTLNSTKNILVIKFSNSFSGKAVIKK